MCAFIDVKNFYRNREKERNSRMRKRREQAQIRYGRYVE